MPTAIPSKTRSVILENVSRQKFSSSVRTETRGHSRLFIGGWEIFIFVMFSLALSANFLKDIKMQF